MRNFDKARYQLQKRARRRTRTYPLATIAYYGPDDQHATKVVVGIVTQSDEVIAMKKWFSAEEDVRLSAAINQEIVDFLDQQHVESVAMPERIIGCPHEEGIDYPTGSACPHCPFWKDKDRWTGKTIA
jgi:hypothetical protein